MDAGRRFVVFLAVLIASGVAAAPATAGLGNDTSSELRQAVSAGKIKQHELALQLIGDLSGGNRLAGTKGYDRSALYVAAAARLAGHSVAFQNFNYDLDLLADWTPPVLRVVSGGQRRSFNPGIAGAQFGGDFGSMYGSTSTDFTAPVWAIDLNLPAPALPNGNTSGCEAADYDGMPDGAIALVQRGTCPFATKFQLAEESGAGGVVFFNEGQPGREVPLWFDVTGLQTPFMAASIPTATALANGVNNGFTGLRARFKIDWRPGNYPTRNVIAETRWGDPNKVIVVGAHLDSVGPGDGINDNGSGSAGILEIAEQLRQVRPQNKIRFIWFSAEESGLLGSEHYVASLPPEERAKIAAMLNFDMIGSPTSFASSMTGTCPTRPLRRAARRPVRPTSSSSSSTTSTTRASPPNRPPSTAAPTMGRSLRRASRPAASSRAPRRSRPTRRRRSTAAPPVSRLTAATTRAATASRT
jgi:hypothetical protein